MSASKLHPSLPAPVVHAGFSIPQSKSHVLAGVQDAYWSDDDAEDAECPLCLEEMDISDLNFKPCICGYQICRFCWHHIKENLNKRCPACRRIYTDDAVEFKPIATQDHKRLTQQKKQRERERKELDALGRRHLANVRVVQRNVVYVVGIGQRFAKEELIHTLRSNEYFGQYGKITKILLVKRTPSGGGAPIVGLYITYHRREDAARAIAAVDGVTSPGGGRDVMRASYGTTKYCMSFLRGIPCNDHNCMHLHEWGDEKDCFTKEDLTTLKHTMKATEGRTRNTASKKPEEQDAALPRAASWAQKNTPISSVNQNSTPSHASTISTTSRPGRRGATPRPTKNTPTSGQTSTHESRYSKANSERRAISGVQSASSRPSTPAASPSPAQLTTSLVDVKPLRHKKDPSSLNKPESPAPSAVESDTGTTYQELSTFPARPMSTDSARSPVPSSLPAPASLGPSAPPGIPALSRPPRAATASPDTPLLSSQSSYQMSTAARALLDDVRARRESTMTYSSSFNPFPDLDRTLQTLSGEDGGSFSFNLDPKLADGADVKELSEFEVSSATPFNGTYLDVFPALRKPTTYGTAQFKESSGPSYLQNESRSTFDSLARAQNDPNAENSYAGSFNPFADSNEEGYVIPSSSPLLSQNGTHLDEERKVSRFGFARGRQGPKFATSPRHQTSQPNIKESRGQTPPHDAFFNSLTLSSPAQQWSMVNRTDYQMGHVPPSILGYAQEHSRFHPFETDLSEAQLREFIHSSRERAHIVETRGHAAELQSNGFNSVPQSFHDPAIMSASFSTPMQETGFNLPTYGPPPGLVYPQTMSNNVMISTRTDALTAHVDNESAHVSATASPTLSIGLSSLDFPALVSPTDRSSIVQEQPQATNSGVAIDTKAQEKMERKAAKKVAAAERAAERQKLAKEKAAIKAAEKLKLAREKIEEKEKAEETDKTFPETKQEKEVKDKPAMDKQKKVQAAPERTKQESSTMDKTEHTETVKASKRSETNTSATPKVPPRQAAKPLVSPEPMPQVPLLSKKPKKNKPVAKVIKVTKEEEIQRHDEMPTFPPTNMSDIPGPPVESSSNNSRSHSLERNSPTSVEELLEEIDIMNPSMDLLNHPFFDIHQVNAASKMPLEYGPLVHALSALSVGGGSFANNMPSGSIDNAVSSFQQLLETLTQTISDLLRLLPRTTWDDSSSFDGVLRDMLKGDDFLDDGGEGQGNEDEVAALTLALERRARWMEVQLSKLEELHRDINTAAVRAVLSFNDNGWDRHGFLPRIGHTLRRFDSISMIEEDGKLRSMTADELEKKLAVAKEAAVFAEVEVRELMEKLQGVKLFDGEL